METPTNKKGFTIIEIIVVLAITTMIAAFTIPSMIGFIEETKMKKEIADAKLVYVAAQLYTSEMYIKDPKVKEEGEHREIQNDIKTILKEDIVLKGTESDANGNSINIEGAEYIAKFSGINVTEVKYKNNGYEIILQIDSGKTMKVTSAKKAIKNQ